MVGDPHLSRDFSMLVYYQKHYTKLTNNHSSLNAISHKDLNILLNKAQKESSSNDSSVNKHNHNNQELTDLISDWSKKSQKILFILNQREELEIKNKNSKSLMALGAMGAHINMALQALKAAELDQQKLKINTFIT